MRRVIRRVEQPEAIEDIRGRSHRPIAVGWAADQQTAFGGIWRADAIPRIRGEFWRGGSGELLAKQTRPLETRIRMTVLSTVLAILAAILVTLITLRVRG